MRIILAFSIIIFNVNGHIWPASVGVFLVLWSINDKLATIARNTQKPK